MSKHLTLHSGAQIPTVGLGTWKSTPGDVGKAVTEAIKAGYRHIDCAAIYGNEAEIGKALQELFAAGVVKREELFITSKLWITQTDPADVLPALAKTLSDLQLGYLDLYLIHWAHFAKKGSSFPLPAEARLGYSPAAVQAVWAELEKAHAAGQVKAIGVSNFTVKKLKELLAVATVKPANNQVELHPFLPQKQLLQFCAEQGITVTAYSPLGSPDRPGASAAAPAPLADATVKAIAEAKGVTPAQVLLRWGVQRGTAVIPKSVTPARIAANADLYSFELTAEEMAALDKLGESPVRLVDGSFLAPEGMSVADFWDGE